MLLRAVRSSLRKKKGGGKAWFVVGSVPQRPQAGGTRRFNQQFAVPITVLLILELLSFIFIKFMFTVTYCYDKAQAKPPKKNPLSLQALAR